MLLTDARLLAILEKGRTNIEARRDVRRGALGEVLTVIEKKEGVGEENLNKYKRKCNQDAKKDANRSKRLRLAGNKEQDNQDQVEKDEAEQTTQMEAAWHLPAMQEVNA